VTGRFFTAFCLRQPFAQESGATASPTRFGFTVPRAIGKACVRNRIKRRMRSVVQKQLRNIAPGWAIIFNPRQSAAEAPFEDLCREVGRIFSRCKES
jgi:ribonuclease P protein component